MSPVTGLAGKFSIPYCVANAILRGNTGMHAFRDAKVTDPEIQTLMRKISTVRDEGRVGLGATVEVETTEGRIHTGSSDVLQEVVELGLKREKIQTKFEDLCLPVMGKHRMEEVRGAILSLERLEDLNLLFG